MASSNDSSSRFAYKGVFFPGFLDQKLNSRFFQVLPNLCALLDVAPSFLCVLPNTNFQGPFAKSSFHDVFFVMRYLALHPLEN